MTDLPRGNNVYGHVFSPDGLKPILDAVHTVVKLSNASICVSGYDGAESLHLSEESVEFESESLGNGRHLLNGGVAGSTDEVAEFVWKLSLALSAAGVDHGFEVYDDDQELVKEIPGSN